MPRLMLILFMGVVAAPVALAQSVEARNDAEIYFNAEQRLQRAETEASCSAWYPDILHRVIDLRSALRRLERFANRDGALGPLQRIAWEQEQQEPGICIGVRARDIEPWLEEARRDTRLLQQRLRRSRWQDPDAWRPK